jgi:hypothetical protein
MICDSKNIVILTKIFELIYVSDRHIFLVIALLSGQLSLYVNSMFPVHQSDQYRWQSDRSSKKGMEAKLTQTFRNLYPNKVIFE